MWRSLIHNNANNLLPVKKSQISKSQNVRVFVEYLVDNCGNMNPVREKYASNGILRAGSNRTHVGPKLNALVTLYVGMTWTADD